MQGPRCAVVSRMATLASRILADASYLISHTLSSDWDKWHDLCGMGRRMQTLPFTLITTKTSGAFQAPGASALLLVPILHAGGCHMLESDQKYPHAVV